jgi:hypothetical protein
MMSKNQAYISHLPGVGLKPILLWGFFSIVSLSAPPENWGKKQKSLFGFVHVFRKQFSFDLLIEEFWL